MTVQVKPAEGQDLAAGRRMVEAMIAGIWPLAEQLVLEAVDMPFPSAGHEMVAHLLAAVCAMDLETQLFAGSPRLVPLITELLDVMRRHEIHAVSDDVDALLGPMTGRVVAQPVQPEGREESRHGRSQGQPSQ